MVCLIIGIFVYFILYICMIALIEMEFGHDKWYEFIILFFLWPVLIVIFAVVGLFFIVKFLSKTTN